MKKRPSGTARRPSPTQSSGPSIIPALSVSPGQQGGARLDEQLASAAGFCRNEDEPKKESGKSLKKLVNFGQPLHAKHAMNRYI